MFIKHVDEALESLLRERLPLPREVGDVVFEAPNDTWAAQLSRLTVNLYLYSIDRSSHPNRTAHTRVDEGTDRAQRRAPQPMIELGYVASAWAGSPADEHQLLGDLVSILAGTTVVPGEHVPDAVSSSVTLALGADEGTRPRDVWQGLGGKLKASLLFRVTVAADTFDWEEQAPAVARISVLSSPSPMAPERSGRS